MGLSEKSASVDASEPVPDGLIWPVPIGDSDIIWLGETDPAHPSGQAIAAPATSAPASDGVSPSAVSSVQPLIALSQLLSSEVAYEWHDAVALVQQLVDQLIPDQNGAPPGSIPQPEAIALGPSGRLRAQIDPTGSEPLVVGIGQLLCRLLQDRPAPAPLRLSASQAASAVAVPVPIGELRRELTGWERPGRLEKLARLYERALVAPPSPSAVVASVPEPPPPVQEREPRKRSRIRSVQMAAAAGLIVTACAIAVVVVRSNVQTGSGSSPDKASPLESSQVPASPRTPLPASSRTPRAPAAAASNPADIQLPSSKAGARSRAAAAALRARGGLSASGGSVDPEPVPSIDAARTNVEASALIYTTDDASVIEPVLIKPYLPRLPRPGITADKFGVLEVVVDTQGRVESVHLKDPSNRYRDRWWVFASKSWQFRPALKDGRPVRFLKRIALTDLDLTEPQ